MNSPEPRVARTQMLQTIADILLRCTILGFGLLLFWFVVMQVASQFVYELHAKLFGLDPNNLNIIFYCALGLWKLGILTLFTLPWVAIQWQLRRKSA